MARAPHDGGLRDPRRRRSRFLSDRVIVLTKRPAKIKAEIPIALARPRAHDVLTTPEFMRLKRQTLELLLDEVTPARRH